ncbi:OmpR/PhoB-type domain-containing protein [Vibrio rotiferianus]|uniref:winged helix-turn-helix domain-containing protein n=1 Tax=Vibrio rotiferianus TaxID=190895 RepID=UPI0028948788|nr:OmpR/PhoB-type domain-containing protein [Vibrio rotiferianus]
MAKLYLEPPVYKVGELFYSPTSAVVDNQGELSRLRAREASLFYELIKTFPEVLSRSSIEQTLWKDSYATNATINQTVKALRFSLQDVDRTLIRTIPKQGYVLSASPLIDNSYGREVIEEPEKNEQPLSGDQQEDRLVPTSKVVNSVATIFVIAITFFALSASGVFVSKPNRVSHQYGKHWILFNATEQELASLPVKPNESTKYITKHESFYRVCSETTGVLECQKIDF